MALKFGQTDAATKAEEAGRKHMSEKLKAFVRPGELEDFPGENDEPPTADTNDNSVRRPSGHKLTIDHGRIMAEICGTLINTPLDSRTILESLMGQVIQLMGQADPFENSSGKLFTKLRHCMSSRSSRLRACALRCLRYCTSSKRSLDAAMRSHVAIYVAYSLERQDPKYSPERVQALKFMQHVMEVDVDAMPRLLVRSLVVTAAEPTDGLRRMCVELVRRLCITNIREVARVNGLRVLISAILDPGMDNMADSLVMTLLFLLNSHNTRKYLRRTNDLEMILSPFTDFSQHTPNSRSQAARVARLKMSRKAVVTMMRSWTGILILTTNPHVGLRSLLNSLLLPRHLNDTVHLHDEIFNTLDDILKVAQPRPDCVEASGLPPRKRGHNLLHNYASMVLLALIHVGAVEVLTLCGKGDNPQIATRSTQLLGRMLMMGSSLLSPVHCAKLHSLPELVHVAGCFDNDPIDRLRATKMLNGLHVVSRDAFVNGTQSTERNPNLLSTNGLSTGLSGDVEKAVLRADARNRPSLLLTTQGTGTPFHLNLLVTEANKWKRIQGSGDEVLDNFDWVRRTLDQQVHDQRFSSLLSKSNVTNTKDHTKWHWQDILDLVEGPLMTSPQRLKEALNTKFVKRLLSFMKPSRKLFACMPWSPDKMDMVRALCRLVEVLQKSEDTCALLSVVAKELADELEKADVSSESHSRPGGALGDTPSSSPPSPSSMSPLRNSLSLRGKSSKSNDDDKALRKASRSDGDMSSATALFSWENVSSTMSREYFTIVGFMTKTQCGIDLMRKQGMFKSLHRILESNRDDLNRLIISSLDYTLDGPSRVFLSTLMTSGSKPLRLHCTRHLRVMLRAGVADFDSWGIDLLATQLYDQDHEVAHASLDVLDEAINEEIHLLAFIRKRPNVKDLADRGRSMMMRIMGTKMGLQYLLELNCCDDELERWREEGNVEYVHSMERRLMDVFTSSHNHAYERGFSRETIAASDVDMNAVSLPPHLYGELARTAEGIAMLKATRHFDELVATLNARGNEVTVMAQRAALWALGHISSSVLGLELCVEAGVVAKMVGLACNAEWLSLRGTCCYVLGLISRTEEGREQLEKQKWQCPPGDDLHISLPVNLASFFHLPQYDFRGSPTEECADISLEGLTEDQTAALTSVSLLTNGIKKKVAQESLMKLRDSSVDSVFRSPLLFMRVQEMLACHNFNMNARRLVNDLFSEVDCEGLDAVPPSLMLWHSTSATVGDDDVRL